MPQQEQRLKWQQIRCEAAEGSELPSGRSGHSLTVQGKKAYLFGGVDKKPAGTPPGPTNDVFVLDMSTGTSEQESSGWKWSRVEPRCEDEPPRPRWNHTATRLSQDKVRAACCCWLRV